MNLKQHNDIVQKLLGQIQLKDKEITKLNKEITTLLKSSNTTNQKSKVPTPSQIQKQVQKRISQLNKQHNAKVTQLNQQIKSLTQQSNELKQRLALKNNLDHKEKQHIAEVIKKNIDRKPGSQHDIKITSLVSHYQSQITKKNTFIQTLKRQVKSLSMNQTSGIETTKKGQPLETKLGLEGLDEVEDSCGNQDNSQRKTVPILEHNSKVQKLQKAIKTLEEKEVKKAKELSDLRNNYNELTKQYYRILNEYGIEAASVTKNSKTVGSANNNMKKPPITQNSSTNSKLQSSQLSKPSSKPSKDSRISFNLTDDDQQEQIPRSINSFQSMADPNDASISVDFEQKFKKFSQRPKLFPQQQQDNEDDYALNNNILKQQGLHLSGKFATGPFQKTNSKKVFHKQLNNPQLTQSIMQLLNVQQQDKILDQLSNMVTKQSFTEVNQQIIKTIHQLLYKFGMGKVSRSQVCQFLSVFESKCQTWQQSYELVNEICIELGAKRNKLMEKIQYYKNSQLQHLDKMKNITFLTQLNKSHKLLEFINFFQLDKSQLQLPEQLKNIHQQLKYVDKFIKQAHMTLALPERKPMEDMLEYVLRKLQTYHEWEVQLFKENQKKNGNKFKSKISMNTEKP